MRRQRKEGVGNSRKGSTHCPPKLHGFLCLKAMVHVPVLYGGGIAERHLQAFMGYLQLATEVLAQVQEMNGGMRLAEVSRQAAVEADNGYGFDYETGLLAEFAGNGCFGSFSCFGPAGRKSPEGIIYTLFQKNFAFGIEQRALYAYFGGDIA